VSTRSFFGGVLLGSAIVVPWFVAGDTTGFGLSWLLLSWGLLAIAGVVLDISHRGWIRVTRSCVRRWTLALFSR
jgi:hypothetical protein